MYTSCPDPRKQTQLYAVLPQTGLADKQAGAAGVLLRYFTGRVMGFEVLILYAVA